MRFSREELEIKNKYSFMNIPDSVFLTMINKAKKSNHFQKALEKELHHYVKENMNLEYMFQYIKSLSISLTSEVEDLIKQIMPFFSFLDSISYELNIDECIVLFEQPLFEKIFSNYKNEEDFQELKEMVSTSKNFQEFINNYQSMHDLMEEESDEEFKENEVVMGNAEGMYLHEIGQKPLLTKEQEQEYFKMLEQGNTEIRKQIIESNLRLVVSVARHYVGFGLSLLDLIQEGNIGLMTAVDYFDYKRGYKFSTYATWWIRQAITRALANTGTLVRIPVHVHESIHKIERLTKKLKVELGRTPTTEEIASAMGMTKDQVESRLNDSQIVNQISLETPIGDDGESVLLDFLPDDTFEQPEEYSINNMLKSDIQKVLETLTEKERNIICLRFGLLDGKTHTLEEIGNYYHVTRERIRQIEAKALRKLRHPYRSKQIKDYLDEATKDSKVHSTTRIQNTPPTRERIVVNYVKKSKPAPVVEKRVIESKMESKTQSNKLIELMKRHPEIALKEWQEKIKLLPPKQRKTIYLVNGESLHENNAFPKDNYSATYQNYFLAIQNLCKMFALKNELEKKPRNVSSKGSNKLIELMKKHPEITIEEWHARINTLPDKQKDVIYLVNGKTLLENNSIPKDTYKATYQNYFLAIQNLNKFKNKKAYQSKLTKLMSDHPEITMDEWQARIKRLTKKQRDAIYFVNGTTLLENNLIPKEKYKEFHNNFYLAIHNLNKMFLVEKPKTPSINVSNRLMELMKEHPEITIEEWLARIKTLTEKQREAIYFVNGKTLLENNSIPTDNYNIIYMNYKHAVKNLSYLKSSYHYQNKLEKLMGEHPEITMDEWQVKIRQLPEKQKEAIYLLNGTTLLENNGVSKVRNNTIYQNYYNAIKTLNTRLLIKEEKIQTEKTLQLKDIFPQEILEIKKYLYVQMNISKNQARVIKAWDNFECLIEKDGKDKKAYLRLLKLFYLFKKENLMVSNQNFLQLQKEEENKLALKKE